MTQALLQMLASSRNFVPTYVNDVFSAYAYTGNGSTQTITNGIDLAGKGGVVLVKNRSSTSNHILQHETATLLRSNLTDAAVIASGAFVSAFNSNGFSIGTGISTNTEGFVSWTFRKAAKFFDVVTLTGDNTGTRNIAHSLGIAPGLVVLKRTDATGDWWVWHRSGTQLGDNALKLNLTDQYTDYGTNVWCAGASAPTMGTSTFSVGDDINITGRTYVAYLFAHATGTDGLIQCGSFTTDGSGNATVNHDWSAGVQFALIKCSSTTGDWEMFDTARTSGWTGSDARLRANLSNAEDSVTRLSASGTSVTFAGLSNSSTYVYLLVKAP